MGDLVQGLLCLELWCCDAVPSVVSLFKCSLAEWRALIIRLLKIL